MSKKLIKSGLIVSFMTLVSRVLGLVRDVVIADVMGASARADVFFFANKIPNFLRRLFAEGAFAQAFVPVLADVKEKESLTEVRRLLAYSAGTLGTIVTVITIIGVIGSPILVAMFGGGWLVDKVNDGPNAEKFDMAALMLKITFPYLWFVTLTALSGAVLNTLGKFAVSSFTPVLLNVSVISFAIFARDWFSSPAYALAWGVFFGGVLQLALQIPFLAKSGMLVRPKWGWNEPGVTKIRKLMLPALFGVSVSQINLMLDTIIATFMVTGSISWLYYADRLLEFPLGLFGIGIATVILPSLAKQHSNLNEKHFAATIEWGLRVVWMFGLPAMAGLMILAKPIIMMLFMRGEFGVDDVEFVSYALLAYMCGLLSFMSIKILAPGFFARQDTKTPVKIGIIAMVSNMAFNLMLAPFFGYVGLAIATAMSALVNVSLLYRRLSQDKVIVLDKNTLLFVARLLIAMLTMAAVVWQVNPSFDAWLEMEKLDQVWHLLGLMTLAMVVYFALLAVLGIKLDHLKVDRIADSY